MICLDIGPAYTVLSCDQYPTLLLNHKRMGEYEKCEYDYKIPQSHTAD